MAGPRKSKVMNTELETLSLVLHEEHNLVFHSWSRLSDAVVRERLAHLIVLRWSTNAESLSAGEELAVTSVSYEHGQCAVGDRPETVERPRLASLRLPPRP